MSSQKPGCLAALFGIGRKQDEEIVGDFFPYKAKPYFFSNAEASFYQFLKQMVGDNVLIFPHVVLRDLVDVTELKEYYKYYNQIDRKQVDYVLVESSSLKPKLVIELDDSSHQREDRKERDIFVEKVFAVTGIPIARVLVKRAYDSKEINELFRRAMQANQSEDPKAK